MAEVDYKQLELHKQWQKNPKLYEKPKRSDHNAPRSSNLIHCPSVTNSLGYVLFVDGIRKQVCGSAAIEFLVDDPEFLRKSTIACKTKPGFHVYYKHTNFWYGVPIHFDELALAIPYLQQGNRVLIQYQFTK